MTSFLIRLALGMACMALIPAAADAQTQKPSKGARKAYAKALEAYRFLSFNLAVEHLDKAIGKSPEYAEAWFLKAQIYQEVEHPDLEDVLGQALALDATRFPHGWVELARVQWELGK